ncbi:helix-turn-helix domain-containing protein [Lactiplantibacillus plantarum subsp. plantarum]|uniref:helix-turn-helix domain-containing protein n=1 Tax=Lactiplantibacillus plantarum TaxID=1590 RepID=UPI0038D4707E
MKNNLSKLIESKNITITDLSKQTGIGRTTLSTLINKDQIPNNTKIGNLLAICKYANISFSDLFTIEQTYDFKKSYPLMQNGENLKIVSIESDNEIVNYQTLLLLRVHTRFSIDVELKVDEAKQQIYDQFLAQLKSENYQIPSDDGLTTLDKINQAISNDKAKMAELNTIEDEIESYFSENNKKIADKVYLNTFTQENFSHLRIKNKALAEQIELDNTSLSFDRFNKEVTETDLISLSNLVSKTSLSISNEESRPLFVEWQLGEDIYHEKRTHRIFKSNKNTAYENSRLMTDYDVIERLISML